MATASSRRVRRDRDPNRAHSFVVEPPADRYDYDPRKDLPACPDTPPEGPWELQGRLWEGRFREGRLVEHRTRFYQTRGSLESQVRQLREAHTGLERSHYGQMRRAHLREAGPGPSDWWSYGINSMGAFGGPLTQYIPLLPGPATRQLYWADYFAMSAKAFEAYQHNPIAHRAVEISVEFVLGRGVEARCKTEKGQAAWDAFWRTNNMDDRLESIMGDLTTYGEVFLRYFLQPGRKLVVRSLDPAGIYEIVTDQEDWETVYFYHQQEQERAQLYAPPAGNQAPTGPTSKGAVTQYTIRQIPAQEIDHYRINARSGEVRGRSDLFPALGYLKRLQDLLTSRVVRSDMEARMVFDLMVKGNVGDVKAQREIMFPQGRAPEPGTVIGHNENVELNAFQFSAGTESAGQGAVEEMVAMCSLGVGVSQQYLWTVGHSGGARANALVATEPGQKRFERRQRLGQRMLRDMAERVFDTAGLRGDDRDIEFIFPSIAVEERSAALKDIAFAESMGWISKKTAASMSARALDIETFDWEDEQTDIAEEFDHATDKEDGDSSSGLLGPDGKPLQKPKQGGGVIRRPMVNATYRQAPKLDPTKAGSSEDQPPGLLMPAPGADGTAPGEDGHGPQADPTAPGRSGIPGDENALTGAGAANIRRDNTRVRESAADPTVVEVVTIALREAHRAGARIPRRRPDDPEFTAAAERYRTQSEKHAHDLVAAIHPAANGDGSA